MSGRAGNRRPQERGSRPWTRRAAVIVSLAVLLSLSSVAWAGPPEEPPTGDPWCREFQGEFPWLCGELAPVPATGQTECYDEGGGQLPSCEGTGQDGDLQTGVEWPDQRFTDSDDGTVRDNLTGLIWLQDADCFGPIVWEEALTAANELEDPECNLSDDSVAGDWRLPNIRELHSLIDYGTYGPALPAGHPFIGLQWQSEWGYWSSTTHANFGLGARIVLVEYGDITDDDKLHYYHVWPVRGGQ